MISLDGSFGEGGGQILRTALTLSLITGQPFRIEHIRAGRAKPGLRQQHLTAVQAAAEISNATVAGAGLGSQTLTFTPGQIQPGHYHFSIGTAGSATLVLQTLLLALALTGEASTLVLEGGTHNPFAPPFDFLHKTWCPLLQRMGLNVTLKLDRLGFYPAGGGKMRALIAPAKLTPIEILARGEIHRRTVRILLANLPEHVAEREIRAIRQRAAWPKSCFQVETISNSPGPGNVVMIEIASESVTEIFTGFGERGVRAEAVAKQALEPALHYGAAAAPVGEHLADQLLLPLALARAGAFLTLPLSPHSLTNLEVIRLFLGISPELQADEDNNCLVRFGA